MQQQIKIVFEEEQPCRLDKHLSELRIQELYSRSFIEKLIDQDRILVNQTPVKKSYLLEAGDEVFINLPEPEPHELEPQDIPLDIVYEDDDLAVINKAAGMIVHPGFGNPKDTLVNAMLFHFKDNLSSGRAADRPGIVHRLDSGTSGLMIIAKNDIAQSKLSDMFARRKIKKTYLAICCGVPDEAEGTIITNIGRSISNPRKMCVTNQGRQAITHYKVLHYFDFFAFLEVDLETGRMHQIRVHFDHLGHPLLGDLLYNTRSRVYSFVPSNMKRKVSELLANHLRRQALHAWRLELNHPISGKALDIHTPPPQDMLYTLSWLDANFAIDKPSLNLEAILKDKIR